jgi:hypothetical protein
MSDVKETVRVCWFVQAEGIKRAQAREKGARRWITSGLERIERGASGGHMRPAVGEAMSLHQQLAEVESSLKEIELRRETIEQLRNIAKAAGLDWDELAKL